MCEVTCCSHEDLSLSLFKSPEDKNKRGDAKCLVTGFGFTDIKYLKCHHSYYRTNFLCHLDSFGCQDKFPNYTDISISCHKQDKPSKSGLQLLSVQRKLESIVFETKSISPCDSSPGCPQMLGNIHVWPSSFSCQDSAVVSLEACCVSRCGPYPSIWQLSHCQDDNITAGCSAKHSGMSGMLRFPNLIPWGPGVQCLL